MAKLKDDYRLHWRRFWDKVIPEPNSGCWIWMGALNNKGYGNMYIGDGKYMSSHKWSYEAHCGKVPKGMVVRHSCGNKCCVNLAHLCVGTYKENEHDKKRHGTYYIGKGFGEKRYTKETCDGVRT